MPTRDTGGSRLLPVACLSIALLGAVGGCGGPAAAPGETAAAPEGELEIREARANLVPGMGAVYLTVVNHGPQSDRLLRVETSVARVAEIHETIQDGGVMRMVPRPAGFEVPANGTLELRPGGGHIMLVEPQVAAGASESIRLTLHFERAGAVAVQAELSGPEAMDHGSMDHGSMDHDGHTMEHGEPDRGGTEPR